ncbi:MAG TPA: hypothetical protein VGM54_01715 [Chthoniobacter sp.]|jgi:hypothetical protein
MDIRKPEPGDPVSPREMSWRLFILPLLLPACGILIWGVLILAFGRFAFVLGIAVQAIYPRRLPH